MELYDAIMTRRSVRKYTDHYVTDDEIKKILEAARWSPSWHNMQCWEFIIIRDRELITRVVETFHEPNPARNGSLAASVLIAFCARTGLSGNKGGVEVTKFNTWFMFDTALAVQNMSLAAHDMGLGSVIVGHIHHDRCADLLGVKPPYELLGILPVGEPLVKKKEGPRRREISSFSHLNRFGNGFI